MRSISLKFKTEPYIVDVYCMICIEIENNCKIAISIGIKLNISELISFTANIQSAICHHDFNVKYTHD